MTVPQVNALEELTRVDGLSLKALSARMGLSHSTVSGIVDRLGRRGFVLKALELASAEERAQALVGIRTLRRLSEAVVSDGGEDRNTKSAASGQEMEDHR